MKIVLRKALGRAGWAVVAAGTLGTVARVAAQPPPRLPGAQPDTFSDPPAGQALAFPYLPVAAQDGQSPPSAASPSQAPAESSPSKTMPSTPAPLSGRLETSEVEPPKPSPAAKKPVRPLVYQTKWRRWDGTDDATPVQKKPVRSLASPPSSTEGVLWLETHQEPATLIEPIACRVTSPAAKPDSYVTGGVMWLDEPTQPDFPLGPVEME